MRESILLIVVLLFLSACSSNDQALDSREEPFTHPMYFKAESEKKAREDLVGQAIGERDSESLNIKQIDRSTPYTNPYTNAESLLLTEELNKLDYIAEVEVASMEDKIMIGVMLKDIDSHKQTSDERFSQQIENEVRNIMPHTDKEIIVFTQESEWGERKNERSRINSPN